jgi:dephospho-CoA kinase
MARDGVTHEQVKARMGHQWSDEKKVELSDFLIYNDESEFLVTQVLEIHQKLLNYGKVC